MALTASFNSCRLLVKTLFLFLYELRKCYGSLSIVKYDNQFQAQDVNYAMDASRRSRSAFAAANVGLEEARNREGLSSIKRALDFNFQDVEGLLRLVRLAMDDIGR